MTMMITKWGNSQGIRLPKAFLRTANISPNDTLDVSVKNETIVIKKAAKRKHQTTKERLAAFYGTGFAPAPAIALEQSETAQEVDWGKPVGSEPNAKTQAAMREAERLSKDPTAKRYTPHELRAELRKECMQ